MQKNARRQRVKSRFLGGSKIQKTRTIFHRVNFLVTKYLLGPLCLVLSQWTGMAEEGENVHAEELRGGLRWGGAN